TTKEIYQNALNEYQKLKEKNGTEKERIINLSYQLFSNVAEIAKLAKAPIHYLKEITLNFNLTHDKGALIEQHFSFLSQIDTQFSELSQNLLTIINKLNDYYNQLETISLELEAQELQIKEKEKLLSEAERNLKKHYLYSPAKGTISKIYLKEGETVNLMGQNLAFQILPDSPFEIKVDIYENEIPKITLNTPVEISFPQFPNEIFFGKVSFISQVPKIKEGVVYYEVKIKPEKLPEKVFSGMSCDVKIIVKEKEDVLVLPREALKKKEGKYFVEVLKEGKKIEKEIGVGIFGEDFVEILSGLKEGEKVILP
ncbi:efflux RND transporter periplasmic adaptor subunit, partial [Candidatus Parcubacteria bacterium]|nr:efflux RND transporter periplasmic adaptor subunit [Candidatus Parcubacteria bacterium]